MEAHIESVNKRDGYTFVKVSWSADIGFGELDFSTSPEGKLEIKTEFMNKEFVMKVLTALVDRALLIN